MKNTESEPSCAIYPTNNSLRLFAMTFEGETFEKHRKSLSGLVFTQVMLHKQREREG